jgi:hypothetical protein
MLTDIEIPPLESKLNAADTEMQRISPEEARRFDSPDRAMSLCGL